MIYSVTIGRFKPPFFFFVRGMSTKKSEKAYGVQAGQAMYCVANIVKL